MIISEDELNRLEKNFKERTKIRPLRILLFVFLGFLVGQGIIRMIELWVK